MIDSDSYSPEDGLPIKCLIELRSFNFTEMMDLTLVVVGFLISENCRTANCILGGDDSWPFKSRKFSKTCELKTAVSNDGQTINIINTPGSSYMESRTSYEEQLMNCINLARDGIHAFLLVVSVETSFSTKQRDIIQSLQKIFGESVLNYIILVFTGGEVLHDLEQSFAEYLDQGCPDSLKDFIRLCNGRCVLFDNKTSDNMKKSKQVHDLLSHVEAIVRTNGNWKKNTTEFIHLINKSYEERMTQIIHAVESRLTDTTTRLEQQLEVATVKVQERAEEYYKGETSELIQRLSKSFEEQMTQKVEEVESRLKDVTTRLGQQLVEAEAARLKADERAEEAQNISSEQIQKLKEADERAEEAQKNSSERIQKLRESFERAEKDRQGGPTSYWKPFMITILLLACFNVRMKT